MKERGAWNFLLPVPFTDCVTTETGKRGKEGKRVEERGSGRACSSPFFTNQQSFSPVPKYERRSVRSIFQRLRAATRTANTPGVADPRSRCLSSVRQGGDSLNVSPSAFLFSEQPRPETVCIIDGTIGRRGGNGAANRWISGKHGKERRRRRKKEISGAREEGEGERERHRTLLFVQVP